MNTYQIIQEALPKSYSYAEYTNLIHQLFAVGKTTGLNQSESYLEYTKLAISRMKRWDKTAKLSPQMLTKMQQIKQAQTWVVITEAWCGDAAHALPIIAKLAETNSLLNLRIVLRDENEALMDAFLSNGKKSIPKMIAFQPEKEEIIFTWGPRPKGATQLVEDELAKGGGITPEAKQALQMWFNRDKGKEIAEEVMELGVR